MNLITPAKTPFPINSHSEILGRHEFGSTISKPVHPALLFMFPKTIIYFLTFYTNTKRLLSVCLSLATGTKSSSSSAKHPLTKSVLVKYASRESVATLNKIRILEARKKSRSDHRGDNSQCLPFFFQFSDSYGSHMYL